MTSVTQSPFKIVQWNVENLFLYLDHYKDQDLSQLSEFEWQKLSTSMVNNKPLVKTRWLAESLKLIDPDIAILSEIGGLESLENFNAHFLKGHYQVFLIEGNSDRGIDLGYLVHKRVTSRFQLFSHKSRPLNFNYVHERLWNQEALKDHSKKTYPSHRFSRDILELRMHDANTDALQMIFLACHLKSKLDREGIDPMGKDRRKAEFETLIKIYQELRAETGAPIVIAGDFNGHARASQPDEEFVSIRLCDWKDVLEIANVPEESRFTRYEIRNGQLPVGQQIDYIFCSPDLHDKVNAGMTHVFRYKNEMGMDLPPITTASQQFLLPSDHYPTVTALDL